LKWKNYIQIPRRRKLATHGSHENTKEEEKKDPNQDN